MGDGVVNPVSFSIPLSSPCHQLPSWEDRHDNNPGTLRQSFSGRLTAVGFKSGCETYISFLIINVQVFFFFFFFFTFLFLMVVEHSTILLVAGSSIEKKNRTHIAEFHNAVRKEKKKKRFLAIYLGFTSETTFYIKTSGNLRLFFELFL